MTSTQDLTDLIIDGIQNRKGRNITIVDMSNINAAATRRFVIAEGTSSTQTCAIAEGIEEAVLKGCGQKMLGNVGMNNGDWIVLDYGETWVHIFLPPVREHYNLEELWSDANITEIPNID